VAPDQYARDAMNDHAGSIRGPRRVPGSPGGPSKPARGRCRSILLRRWTRVRRDRPVRVEPPSGARPDPGIRPGLLHLHIAAGTSYFKVPRPATSWSRERASPLGVGLPHHLYDDGLRSSPGRTGSRYRFPCRSVGRRIATRPSPDHRPAARTLVPIGEAGLHGVIEAVRTRTTFLFAVNPHPSSSSWPDRRASICCGPSAPLANLSELNGSER